MFPHLPDNRQFNRCRQHLTEVMECIRHQYDKNLIDLHDPVCLIDSALFPACTYTRYSCFEMVLGYEPVPQGGERADRLDRTAHELDSGCEVGQDINRFNAPLIQRRPSR